MEERTFSRPEQAINSYINWVNDLTSKDKLALIGKTDLELFAGRFNVTIDDMIQAFNNLKSSNQLLNVFTPYLFQEELTQI